MFITCSALLLSSAVTLSHETATTARVTPAGVFLDTVSAPQTKGGSLSVVNPNPSPLAVRWSYPNGAPGPWITDQVSVGNSGTFAWLGQNLNAERLSLVATTDDQSPALPIWEDVLTGADLIDPAAADKAPICAVAYRDPPNGVFEVRLYVGFNPTMVASAPITTTGALEIAISDDGNRVAVGCTDPSTNLAKVEVFDTAGGTGLFPLSTILGIGTSFREHDISSDGQVVLLATQNSDQLYDAASGSLIFQDNSTVSVDAHAIDADGDVWVRGGFDLGAWINVGGTWTRIVNFKDTAGFGFFVSTACDVSADGSTFVAAAYDATNSNLMRVYCFDLAPTGSTLLWTYASVGTGTFQDTPQSVSISDDGKFIAVATWGTQNNAHPETLLFDRDVGNAPIGGIDSPGSPFDCDISGDGQFTVSGGKAVHANTFGNGGAGYSLDRGDQGLRMFGTPSINRTITIELGGLPGETALLAASFALLPVPLTAPSFVGTFDLDPSLFLLAPTGIGVFPGSGLISFSTLVPNAPAAVGITVYAQEIRSGTVITCDNHIALPITP